MYNINTKEAIIDNCFKCYEVLLQIVNLFLSKEDKDFNLPKKIFWKHATVLILM